MCFGQGKYEQATRDPLEMLSGKFRPLPLDPASVQFFNETGTLFWFSACLVYFHEGVNGLVWEGQVKKNFPGSLSHAMTVPTHTADLLFTLVLGTQN